MQLVMLYVLLHIITLLYSSGVDILILSIFILDFVALFYYVVYMYVKRNKIRDKTKTLSRKLSDVFKYTYLLMVGLVLCTEYVYDGYMDLDLRFKEVVVDYGPESSIVSKCSILIPKCCKESMIIADNCVEELELILGSATKEEVQDLVNGYSLKLTTASEDMKSFSTMVILILLLRGVYYVCKHWESLVMACSKLLSIFTSKSNGNMVN